MKTTSPSLGYLVREAVLLIAWSYVLLVGGTINGLFVFRVQAATAALTAAGLGLWLIWRWRRGGRQARTGLEWPAVIFIAAQLAAALLGQDVRRGLPLAAQSITYVLVFYALLDVLRSGWPAELLEKTLLIGGGIVIGLALVNLAQGWLSWLDLTVGQPVAPGFDYRLYAPLGDANLLAAVIVVLTPPALARALTTPRRFNRLVLGGWLGAAALVLIFTYSRGGQAGVLAGLGVLAVLWVGVVSTAARLRVGRWWKQLRARPWLLAGLAAVLVLGAAAAAGRVLSFRGSATQGPALSARSEFWPAALNAFTESPLWGKGPGTYPSEYMRFNSVPPGRVYLHAHSVTLNTLAEAGLLGLGSSLLALAALARAWWRARPQPDLAARARWAAAAAAWAGFLVHSQVDDHTRYLAVAGPLIALLAGALAEAPEAVAPRRTFHLGWLIAPAAAVLAFTGITLRAYALSEQAVEAGQAGNWAAASAGFDAAADADPALAFYWEQAGYAYGRLAEAGSAPAVEQGIERLQRAAALEPRYAVPFANLAALQWRAGQRAEALAAIRTAVQLAPGDADFQLNLGRYAEALDPASAEAQAAYRQALALDPRLAGASWWAATALRQAVLAGWTAPPAAGLAEVRAQIAAGAWDTAERALLESWAADDQQLPVYIGLAEVARARGDREAAEQYTRLALAIQTTSITDQVEALLTAAVIAAERGEAETALWRYQSAFAAVTDYGTLGWGSAGWTPHDFFAFQRRGLPLDLLPELARSSFSLELGERLMPLGALYEARGERTEAVAVYRRLLELEPGLQPARAALTRLGEADAP